MNSVETDRWFLTHTPALEAVGEAREQLQQLQDEAQALQAEGMLAIEGLETPEMRELVQSLLLSEQAEKLTENKQAADAAIAAANTAWDSFAPDLDEL